MHDAITDVAGIRVGQYTDLAGGTGCTIVLYEEGAVAGVDIRGAAPGTRETDVLRPGNLVTKAQAIMLTGGSAFGLDAAAGVMRYLAERGHGERMSKDVLVPIVPAAVVFDLSVGDSNARPAPADAYRACAEAADSRITEGNAGAGTGATVGKLFGPAFAMKGGVGTASEKLPNGAIVGALAVVNAVGDVVDPGTGQIVAGARRADGSFVDSARQLRFGAGPASIVRAEARGSTTLVVVATDAALSKEQANRLAQLAHNGMVMAVRPCNTMYDGDAVFTMATGEGPSTDITVLGGVAGDVVATAILRAVGAAGNLFGIPGAADTKL